MKATNTSVDGKQASRPLHQSKCCADAPVLVNTVWLRWHAHDRACCAQIRPAGPIQACSSHMQE